MGAVPRNHPSDGRKCPSPGQFPVGKRGHGIADGVYRPDRKGTRTRRHCYWRSYVRLCAIKTSIADSLNTIVQMERKPGKRFVSEVVEIRRYDPDDDKYDFNVVFNGLA